MSFVQLRLPDMRTGLLWNENLFAGADRCACSICTGTHSSDKKLNASVLPGWDLWSSLQQRVMLFLCIFNAVPISGCVWPQGSGSAAEFIFVTETSSASHPRDCFWCPWRQGSWSGSGLPSFSPCAWLEPVLDHELWWHYTVMQGALFMSHDFSFFGLFFPGV